MSENNTSMFILEPVPSPDDIIRNKNYHECQNILDFINSNICNFLAKYNVSEVQNQDAPDQKKMCKALRFVYDDMMYMVRTIKTNRIRIYNFITDIITEVVKERDTSDEESIKKRYIERLKYAPTDDSEKFIINDAINRYLNDDNDYEIAQRLLLIYDNYETWYFNMCSNLVKLYNTFVDIYQINEIDKCKENLKHLEKGQKELFGKVEIPTEEMFPPEPGIKQRSIDLPSSQKLIMTSKCENCKDELDGEICEHTGEYCYHGEIKKSWGKNSWFYS